MVSHSGVVACERCQAEFAADALFCPMCGAPRAKMGGDPLIGEVVADRYLLRQRLGHGGSGTIYLAEHVTLRRRVVVKILHHELSRDELAVERFRREATTVGQIDNEHIVEVLDFGRTKDGRLFLAMEYLDGETLAAALVRMRQLPIAQVTGILVQLGEALMEAHALGYVHRDLRPRNVFLARRRGQDGFVKLLDFGLAKLVEREGEAASTSLGMTFGDPRYMSPEQAHGNPVDRRSDIYSLGVIAYEMLAGMAPFVGKKVFDVLTAHLETEPTPPSELRSEVPAWLESVVLRMLAKQPGDRFVTVYRLVEALREGMASGRIMADEEARSVQGVMPPPPAPRSQELGASAPGESKASAPGMSGAWYDEGEALAQAEASSSAVRRLDPIPAASASWQDPEEKAPHARRWVWIVPLCALLLGGVVVVTWPSRGSHDASAPDAAPATVLSQVAPADATPAAPPEVTPDAAPSMEPKPEPRTSHAEEPRQPTRGPGLVLRLGAQAPDAAPPPPSESAQGAFFIKLGGQALRQGDYATALGHFNKAREFAPGSAEAIAGLGEVALRQGSFSDAVVHLTAAARLAPGSARIQTLLGQAYLGVGKSKAAQAAFRKALTIDPDNAEARKGYERAEEEAELP
jgi:serine/threonine-protein kinase